jgi:hypothetical protein
MARNWPGTPFRLVVSWPPWTSRIVVKLPRSEVLTAHPRAEPGAPQIERMAPGAYRPVAPSQLWPFQRKAVAPPLVSR